MADFKKMTLETLRDVARKVLGPGHARYRTKGELVRALERAAEERGEPGAAGAGGEAARPAATPVRRAAKAAKEVGKAAREGVRAVVRAGKAAGEGAAGKAKRALEPRAGRKPRKGGVAAAAVAGAAAGVAATVTAAKNAAKAAKAAKAARTSGPPKDAPDPEGYFVARVRGEDAVRDAPHPMTETTQDAWAAYEEAVGAPVYDEQLGELPWSYGDDAFVALPRDPHTLFLYWDHSRETLARGFEGLDHARAQLWVFARAGEGWDRLRAIDFALESRGYYVHDLEPGRRYRAEIHLVDRGGRERLLGSSSNECVLPPVGVSPVVDDRFARIPWDVPLGRLLGPGHAGGPFSDEARAMLSRLSDWSRFGGGTWGGSAGGMGGRPSSPTSSPSSPFGGGGER